MIFSLCVDHEFNLYKCAKAHDLRNCNKRDMARNFIASSVSDLEAAGRSASASNCIQFVLECRIGLCAKNNTSVLKITRSC